MNYRLVAKIIGVLLIFCALFMLAPLGISYYYNENDLLSWIISIAITLFVGVLLRSLNPVKAELSHREGFAVVTLSWLTLGLFGALPLYISESLPTFIDSYFEAISGLTTTGSTVIEDLSIITHGILFWRSLLHWLGGMGIIVLTIAILPFLGVGGLQLYKAEVPGPSKDRLTPRIANTAKLLWGIYILMTLTEILLLYYGGMPVFESICHTFGTVATGGFSTYNASIGAYNNPYFSWVISFFMFSAGINFFLHYRFMRGHLSCYLVDKECQVYIMIIVIASIVVFFNLWGETYIGVEEAARHSVFQVLTIITTTGYCTTNYALWPFLAQSVLFVLMLFGGCAGSTGGGMKIIRIIVLIKQSVREVRKFVHPNAVISTKLGNKTIDPEIVTNILGFFFLYVFTLTASGVFLSFLGLDIETAFSSVLACLGNIGPGLGGVGPSCNFAFIPGLGKLVLLFCMVLGRLEIYTVLVLFSRTYWRNK